MKSAKARDPLYKGIPGRFRLHAKEFFRQRLVLRRLSFLREGRLSEPAGGERNGGRQERQRSNCRRPFHPFLFIAASPFHPV